nr:insulinase family protein [Lachnospiraceae bacterium]
MKRKMKQIMALALSAVLLTSCAQGGQTGSGASAGSGETNETAASTETAATETASTEMASADGTESQETTEETSYAFRGDTSSWKKGDEIHGFTLEDIQDLALLDAKQFTFTHEYSGAKLIYVQNEDKELAFNITFRTPMANEADANHVFEHSIIAGSGKYPAKNLFFDLSNKAYMTLANAYTFPIMTTYPLCSMSEEQLLKGMDCYMSCMVDPLVMKDENIFKREAVRYELDSPEDDIQMLGTVYSEDYGSLTDETNVGIKLLLKTLYPGEFASNFIGQAHHHYKELTWDLLKETYENYYHFDNSLIGLYGDMDVDRFLSFLDEEYLSKQKAYGTDLSPFMDPETDPGYVEAEGVLPVYKGDATENMSRISYAFSTVDFTAEETVVLNLVSSILNSDSSYMNQLLREKGIENPVRADLGMGFAKNFWLFTLSYADPSQKEELKEVALETLKEVSENGVDQELLESFIRSFRRDVKLLRDSSNAGEEVLKNNALFWATDSTMDYYYRANEVYNQLEKDTDQKLVKEVMGKVLNSNRSALTVLTPVEGKAEEHDKEVENYLKDMKEGMTEEEIQDLIKDTQAFREWNAEEKPNNDFIIDPADVPKVELTDNIEVSEEKGTTIYQGY